MFNVENLQVVHSYLFGGVKFLDLLMLAMLVDIVTGITVAWKEKRLRSRTGLYGYARKIGVFGLIIVANIIDVILDLNGMVAHATVLFYILNEVVSITENAGKLGMKVPKMILDKLQVIQEQENKGEDK